MSVGWGEESVLYCIVLYCIVLYCIVLYCIVLYCIVLYCIVLYCIVLYCIVLYCIVLYCIVLYCIMRPYTDGRLDRYCIDIPRELSEIRTQSWLSEGSLPAIHVTTGDQSFNCAPTQFHQQCHCYHIMNDMLDCHL